MNTCKKLLMLLLVLVLLLATAACGQGGKLNQEQAVPAICGIWEMEINLTDTVNTQFAQIIGEDITLPDTDIHLIYTMDIREGDQLSMSLTLDEDSLDEYYEDLCDVVVEYAISYIGEEGMTKQELEDKCQSDYGMSLNEYILSMLMDSSPVSASSFPAVSEEGYYRIDGDKLWIADAKEGLANTQEYMVYSLNGDQLIIHNVSGSDTDASGQPLELFGQSFPWTFVRQ